ncbi:MAG: hypothetical protein ACJAYE_000939 [Candidatus Azotimanducaceae bacterium]
MIVAPSMMPLTALPATPLPGAGGATGTGSVMTTPILEFESLSPQLTISRIDDDSAIV